MTKLHEVAKLLDSGKYVTEYRWTGEGTVLVIEAKKVPILTVELVGEFFQVRNAHRTEKMVYSAKEVEKVAKFVSERWYQTMTVWQMGE